MKIMMFFGFPFSALCLRESPKRVHGVFLGEKRLVLGLTVGISMLEKEMISIEDPGQCEDHVPKDRVNKLNYSPEN